MELFLLRHGEVPKRLYQSAQLGNYITYFGKLQIEDMAHSLKKLKIKIELIVTSPIPSSRQTTEVINNILKTKIIVCEDLKPEGNILKFYNMISRYDHLSSILVVGHEPYLSTMIGDIISNKDNDNGRPHIILKKAGLSKIRITSTTPELKGELRWLLTPGFLKRLSKSL